MGNSWPGTYQTWLHGLGSNNKGMGHRWSSIMLVRKKSLRMSRWILQVNNWFCSWYWQQGFSSCDHGFTVAAVTMIQNSERKEQGKKPLSQPWNSEEQTLASKEPQGWRDWRTCHKGRDNCECSAWRRLRRILSTCINTWFEGINKMEPNSAIFSDSIKGNGYKLKTQGYNNNIM